MFVLQMVSAFHKPSCIKVDSGITASKELNRSLYVQAYFCQINAIFCPKVNVLGRFSRALKLQYYCCVKTKKGAIMSIKNNKQQRIVRSFINEHGKLRLRQLQFHIRKGASNQQLQQAYNLSDIQISTFREICLANKESRLLG